MLTDYLRKDALYLNYTTRKRIYFFKEGTFSTNILQLDFETTHALCLVGEATSYDYFCLITS